MTMATLNINRRGGENPVIEVQFVFGVGETLSAEVSLENFALALTGRSEIPVDLRMRNVRVESTKKSPRKREAL